MGLATCTSAWILLLAGFSWNDAGMTEPIAASPQKKLTGCAELPWYTDLDEARFEAIWRNAPLLIVMATETNDSFEMVRGVLSGTKFRSQARDWVLCVGMKGIKDKRHARTRIRRGRQHVELCTLFGMPCAEHEKCYKLNDVRFIKRTFYSPLLLYMSPRAEEIYRTERYQEAQRVSAEMTRVEGKVGKSRKRTAYLRWRKEEGKALDAAEKLRPEKAIKLYTELYNGFAKDELMTNAAAAGLKAVNEIGNREISRIMANVDELGLDRSLRSMRQIVKQFTDLPCGEVAQTKIALLEGR